MCMYARGEARLAYITIGNAAAILISIEWRMRGPDAGKLIAENGDVDDIAPEVGGAIIVGVVALEHLHVACRHVLCIQEGFWEITKPAPKASSM